MISIIVALAQNGVIGCKNRLIWHISEDLKRFKRITMGHPVVMGRRTFESMGCRLLPGRMNVVVTRDLGYAPLKADNLLIVHSLEEAIGCFSVAEEVFVIGGGEIYRQALPLADRLYLTRIAALAQGDVYFPEVDTVHAWRLVWKQEHAVSEQNPVGYVFEDYCRVGTKG